MLQWPWPRREHTFEISAWGVFLDSYCKKKEEANTLHMTLAFGAQLSCVNRRLWCTWALVRKNAGG